MLIFLKLIKYVYIRSHCVGLILNNISFKRIQKYIHGLIEKYIKVRNPKTTPTHQSELENEMCPIHMLNRIGLAVSCPGI